MTLAQLISIIEKVASSQPAVNMIVRNDVFRINSAPSLKYGVFAWTQGQHSGNVVTGFNTYTFSLFYVDRLKEDLSNQVEVQSVGCEVIGNILRFLEEYDIEVTSYTMQPFDQRFKDNCAGVFSNVSVSVPATSMCGLGEEANGDFSFDYNKDFLIF